MSDGFLGVVKSSNRRFCMGRPWKAARFETKVSKSREFPDNEATERNDGAVSHRL
jgi:hypothetical protein